jgi:HSP20 family protein
MALVRWDPFRELETLQGRMSRLFQENFGRPPAEGSDGLWSPVVDIMEDEQNLIVKAELPDVEEKDLEIKVENNVLTLRGEKKLEREEKREQYHLIESSYGSFSRSFTLPGTVDQEKIAAVYEKGVLRITLPKKPEAKAKTVKIVPKKAA